MFVEWHPCAMNKSYYQVLILRMLIKERMRKKQNWMEFHHNEISRVAEVRKTLIKVSW